MLSLFASGGGFAGYGLWQSYVARKQSELQRHIAQDSKDIEWMIRHSGVFACHCTTSNANKTKYASEWIRSNTSCVPMAIWRRGSDTMRLGVDICLCISTKSAAAPRASARPGEKDRSCTRRSGGSWANCITEALLGSAAIR